MDSPEKKHFLEGADLDHPDIDRLAKALADVQWVLDLEPKEPEEETRSNLCGVCVAHGRKNPKLVGDGVVCDKGGEPLCPDHRYQRAHAPGIRPLRDRTLPHPATLYWCNRPQHR